VGSVQLFFSDVVLAIWYTFYLQLQVSFVNGIATIRGGTHVEYVFDQLANHVKDIVNRKDKNANMKLHTVRGHLWVFVNARIDNPAFDS
jgi:DNA topoisomerase-2